MAYEGRRATVHSDYVRLERPGQPTLTFPRSEVAAIGKARKPTPVAGIVVTTVGLAVAAIAAVGCANDDSDFGCLGMAFIAGGGLTLSAVGAGIIGLQQIDPTGLRCS
ncbi:MAG: hypothetical protein ACI9MR_005180 [Myxococcota bacterium]|jgi:hypothetical protein